MATAQTTARKSSRGNGKDHKAVVARAARDERRSARDSAETFISGVKSSAHQFGKKMGRRVSQNVSSVTRGAKGVQHRAQDTIRYRPLLAVVVAAGAGALLALLTRR